MDHRYDTHDLSSVENSAGCECMEKGEGVVGESIYYSICSVHEGTAASRAKADRLQIILRNQTISSDWWQKTGRSEKVQTFHASWQDLVVSFFFQTLSPPLFSTFHSCKATNNNLDNSNLNNIHRQSQACMSESLDSVAHALQSTLLNRTFFLIMIQAGIYSKCSGHPT